MLQIFVVLEALLSKRKFNFVGHRDRFFDELGVLSLGFDSLLEMLNPIFLSLDDVHNDLPVSVLLLDCLFEDVVRLQCCTFCLSNLVLAFLLGCL